MKTSALKQRIVGAIFILSLGVILIPVILDTPSEEVAQHYSSKPDAPPLPKINEVAKINYVFNDLNEASQAEIPIIAQTEPTNLPSPEPESASEPEIEPESPLLAEQSVLVVPAEEPTSSARELPKVSPTHLGDWTIQLGAFSSKENANELMSKLTKEGFQSYLKQSAGGNHLVRVFVAPGIEKSEAQDLLSKLDTKFGIKGILVRYREE